MPSQERPQDELLPADQGRALVPARARLLARGGVPEEAVWAVFRYWCVGRASELGRWVGLIEWGMGVGGEFRGFHIRFKDVARGGIRIVMSRNRE